MSTDAINIKEAPYNAAGNGMADDTHAIQCAIKDALAQKRPIYAPAGTYKLSKTDPDPLDQNPPADPYCLLVETSEGFSITGNNALFRFPSGTAHGFLLPSNCTSVKFDGVRFQGDDTDTITSTHSAIYLVAGASDTTISNCWFTKGSAVSFGSDRAAPGRFIFDRNRVIDCVGGISAPYRTIITNNIFDATDRPGTRTHCVYIYGPADGCLISGNIFRKSDTRAGTFAIQIRASSAQYNYKHTFAISDNVFYECGGCMWLGSDEVVNVSGFAVTGNSFHNSSACVRAFGLRNLMVSGNVAEYDWRFPADGSGAFEVGYVAGTNTSQACSLIGNSVVNRHPFFGRITIGSHPPDEPVELPEEDETVTVGDETYTWKNVLNIPAVAGEVLIGSTAAACAASLAAEIRGERATPMNKVLRDPQDCLNDRFSYDGAATDVVIVASAHTFQTTTTSSQVACEAVVDHRGVVAGAFMVTHSQWPRITENTIEDVYTGISVENSMNPTIERNSLLGSFVRGTGNVLSVWRDNNFVMTPTKETAAARPTRWMLVMDGFTTIDGNGMGEIVANEYQTIAAHGSGGTIAAGNGRAQVWFYYGRESLAGGSGQVQTLPWRWNDGDQVKLSNGVTSYTASFKRVSPGANEFNSADSLITWIANSTGGTYSAGYAPWFDLGGSANPMQMIYISRKSAGTEGNNHYVQVRRDIPTSGPDLKSIRMCGAILINRAGDLVDQCYFRGGAAEDEQHRSTKTVVFSPNVSAIRGVTVQGVNAAAEALNPIVYRDDIVPGVCFTITHEFAPSETEFFYRVH